MITIIHPESQFSRNYFLFLPDTLHADDRMDNRHEGDKIMRINESCSYTSQKDTNSQSGKQETGEPVKP
jgi:hypothetical protein